MADRASVTPTARGVAQFAEPEQEAVLLRLVADGLTNREIGNRLRLSEKTIVRAMRSLLARWGTSDRTSLVVRACKAGVLVVGRRRCEAEELTVGEYQRDRVAFTELLTPHQMLILPLLAAGLTNTAIARRLRIDPETVKSQVQRAAKRAGARGRTNLVFLACKHGLISLEATDA